mmetsp:Transcript_31939/g.77823  ORF Transcript_31939/g.77823 Transcript_31939/m.77823 type:complete len:613 (-) Transcript_31939:187-2025(-)|eukprot:CAMPEP_0114508476 /NCGR_PEP_ID=MMETSP0109-20121206/12628_1 /TAXON_ID=29199 /ORGANISM="Chlorarachnion reptans, Strain CCCM449" /LENGTH=612 /DNA_ID=CAMNT_0001687427 /DNA_START=11 /DNA_END=1849 /DNA_ORIENTATION=-
MSGYSRIESEAGRAQNDGEGEWKEVAINSEDLKRGIESRRMLHSIFSFASREDLERKELKKYTDNDALPIPNDAKDLRELSSLLNLLPEEPEDEKKEGKEEKTWCEFCCEDYEFDPQGRRNPIELQCGQEHYLCRSCLQDILKEDEKLPGYQTYECYWCKDTCILKKGSIETKKMSAYMKRVVEPILQRRVKIDAELRSLVSEILNLIRNKVTVPDLFDKIKSDKKLYQFMKSKVQSDELPEEDWIKDLVARLGNSCLEKQSPKFKFEAARVLLARVRGSCWMLSMWHKTMSTIGYEEIKPYFCVTRVLTASAACAVGARKVIPILTADAVGAAATAVSGQFLISIPVHLLSDVSAGVGGAVGFIVELAFYLYPLARHGGTKSDWQEFRLRTVESAVRWTISSVFAYGGMVIGAAGGPLLPVTIPVCAGAAIVGIAFGLVGYLVGYLLGNNYILKDEDKEKFQKATVGELVLAFIRLVGENPFSIAAEDLDEAKMKTLGERIRKNYYSASLKVHPDKNGTTEEFQRLISQKQMVENCLVDIEARGSKRDPRALALINTLWEELKKSRDPNSNDYEKNYMYALGYCKGQGYCTSPEETSIDSADNSRDVKQIK